ncbi:MAG: TlpA disulfide reductase family protein, partial [Verrucomicrobiota bacterium]
PIESISETTSMIDYRLFWDQSTGEVIASDLDGQRLASVAGRSFKLSDNDGGKERGFSIVNHTPEMQLVNLRIRNWDGDQIPSLPSDRPHLRLSGRDTRYDVGQIVFEIGSSKLTVGREAISLADLEEIQFSPTPADREMGANLDPENGPGIHLVWFAGTSVSGELRRLRNGGLSIQPSWSKDALLTNLVAAKEIRFGQPDRRFDPAPDRLEIGDVITRGSLRPVDPIEEGQASFGWLAPGARSPVPFSDGIEATVTRDAYGSTPPNRTVGRARIHLINNETLAGEVISIDKDFVRFSSRFTGEIDIPQTHVRALDIDTAGRIMRGFQDHAWETYEVDENDIDLGEDRVVMKSGGFGNGSLLLGDKITFRAEWKDTYGAITLRLFGSDEQETTPATDLVLATQGNRVFVGRVREGGAFSFTGNQIPIDGTSARFDVEARHNYVLVKVNGKISLETTLTDEHRSGNGIFFKMGGGRQGWNSEGNVVTLTDFAITSSPGHIPQRFIEPRHLDTALTLPRFRRDPVPTHLLIGANGDLLRGSLLGAAGGKIHFQSQGTDHQFARHRVSGIAWLRSDPYRPDRTSANPVALKDRLDRGAFGAELPAETELAAMSEFEVTHRFLLIDGSSLDLHSKAIEEDEFIGTSSILGTCRIPMRAISQMDRNVARTADRLSALRPLPYDDWYLRLTPDPNIPEGDGREAHPMEGKVAPAFTLEKLDGGEFELSDYRGRVVVLDFWASWCGPCIRAIPDVRNVIAAFPPRTVELCAVNQSETRPIISEFLENRSWQDLPVGLDFGMKVSELYGVEGIPHTVVINRAGNIQWVHSGYTREFKDQLLEAIGSAFSP